MADISIYDPRTNELVVDGIHTRIRETVTATGHIIATCPCGAAFKDTDGSSLRFHYQHCKRAHI